VGDLTVAVTEETEKDTEAAATASDEEMPATDAGARARRPAPTGLAAVLSSGDHKTTGRLFISLAFLFLVVAGVAGGLLGIERVDAAGLDLLSEANLVATFTLHDVTAVFLFLLPLVVGLAIYVVPLQVGASTVAFPRAATAAFWAWLLGGALLLASYIIDGGPGGTDRNGVLLWLAAFGIVIVALGLATICAVATVLTLRCEGMRLDRVPLFSWSVLVGGTIWLLSLPVLVGGVVLLWLDVRYGAGLLTGQGGIYTHLAWVFLVPQIFAYAVPALGVVGEVVPVFARAPLARRDVVLGLLGGIAALGFGAWVFILPESPELPEQALYVGVSLVLFLVVLGFTGGVLDAMRRGRFSMAPPVLAGVLGSLLVLAGAAAAAFGVLPFNDLLTTTWFSGVGHLVLGGASVILLGAVYYWAPKIWGRVPSAGSGGLAVVAAAAGIALLALPDLVTGTQGQDARLPIEQEVESSWDVLNAVALAGGVLLVLAVLLVLVALAAAVARRDAEPAADDPWDGHTLEWATPSPPPIGNFSEAPTVTSATPLLDARPTEPAEAEEPAATEEAVEATA
jgi:heme/copper-type cytochrome/quinol oxidase subunit 1